MAKNGKSIGPIVTAVFEVIMMPIHYIVFALASAAGAVVATANTAGETGSTAAAETAGNAGLVMVYVGTWGGSALMLLGALALLVGTILSFSNKNGGARKCAGFASFAGWFLFLMSAYIVVTCGVMTGQILVGCYAALPTFVAALFMLKSGRTLRNMSTL